MIKPNDLQTKSVRIQSLWQSIWRQIQSYIEHTPMFNGEAADIAQGHVVYCSADRTVMLARTDSVAQATAIGVVDDSPTGPGVQCSVAHDGYRLVHFVDGLDATLAEGDMAYVSATPGVASNVAGDPLFILGQVANASMYVGVAGPTYYPFAMVLLGDGCCLAENR